MKNTELPRRGFLVASAAALAGISVAFGDEVGAVTRREVDVAIVGAGLAGLTAARALKKKGLRVCVLEARSRPGGRNLDYPIGNGAVVEGGGQWVGPGQDRILALAADLGVKVFDSYTRGKTAVMIGRFRIKAGADSESAELRRVKKDLEQMAATVPVADPWNSPRAQEWDAITVQQWLTAHAKQAETFDTFALDCETELGSPDKISLLWYLFYLRSAGGTHRALNVDAQRWRLAGGPQQLSLLMSGALGDEVVTASPVKRITDLPGNLVEVESQKVLCTAKRVIVAMMPADTRRIEFSPALPAARRELANRWTGESAVKVNAVYDKPFWREDGLSGLGISGNAGVTFDNSPADGSQGVLLAFLSIDKVPKDPVARKAAVLKDLVSLFGKRAGAPRLYIETDWSADGWSAGCVSPVATGVLTQYGHALRAPVGRVHWAGTETSEVWCGYMDGAVRSGERVAAEVAASLQLG